MTMWTWLNTATACRRREWERQKLQKRRFQLFPSEQSRRLFPSSITSPGIYSPVPHSRSSRRVASIVPPYLSALASPLSPALYPDCFYLLVGRSRRAKIAERMRRGSNELKFAQVLDETFPSTEGQRRLAKQGWT